MNLGMETMLKGMGVDTAAVKEFAESLKGGLQRMDARLKNIEDFMVRIELQIRELRADLTSDVDPAGGTYHDLVAATEKGNDDGKR